MPKKTKSIPTDRALFTFGDAVWWHFFIHGTRPDRLPHQTGRVWSPQTAAAQLGCSVRTLWNWVDNDPPPYDTAALERVLFGSGADFDDWREELRRLLGEARAKPKAAQAVPAGRGMVLYAVDYPDKDDPDVIDAEFEVIPAGGPENIGNDRKNRTGAGGASAATAGRTIARVTDILFPKNPRRTTRPSRRYRIPIFAVGVTALFVIAAVSLVSRKVTPPPTKTAATNAPTIPPVVEPASRLDPPAPQPTPAALPASPPSPSVVVPSPTVAAPEPAAVQPVPEPKPTSSPVKPAEAPAQVAPQPAAKPSPDEEMLRKTIDALKAGQEAKRIASEKQAMRRDQEEQAAAQTITNREAYTRQIAGMGFAVKENQSIVGGGPFGPILTASVQECALSCRSVNCDGFAYFRAQPVSVTPATRYCYRYKKPLTFFAHGDYTSGEMIADLAALSQAAPPTAPQPTVLNDADRVAQTGTSQSPSVASPASDGLTRCANGPVEVTGFTLTCDKLLTGGTALGSTQLAYIVNDINDCAAKCRPIQACTGFTFNAAEQAGRRSCQIFGGRPGANNGNGWISGTR